MSTAQLETQAQPARKLSLFDALAFIVGIVIGAGIFRTPSDVAGLSNSPAMFFAVWLAGGVISLVGALVYAELATAYPRAGGDFNYLHRAYGRPVAFLFAWARLAVIQTGSIALLAFVFGDYATQIFSFGAYSSSIYAALIIVVLTLLNISGVEQGSTAQKLLTTLEVGGVILIIIAGLSITPDASATLNLSAQNLDGTSFSSLDFSSFGTALVIVLLTYGGWNEAAFVAGEVRDVRRNMWRALVFGIGFLIVVYMLVNFALWRALGLAELAASKTVATTLFERAFGAGGATFISILVAVSALTSASATIFTGARTSFALGADYPLFGFLGRWNARLGTPANALIAQGLVSLMLVMLGTGVLFGTGRRDGFAAMIDYTAPVFWFFFLLTGIAFFILRRRDAEIERPFRVPLYPLLPLIFCLSSAYMLYSSIAFYGTGALVGVAVLMLGVPVFYLGIRR